MKSATAMQPTSTEEVIANFSQTMREHLREHVDGTNVNPDSLLTTDYLNHYSSMVMLLEQLPETPEELIIYLLSWEPLSYEDHFKTSGFRDGDLAITAYRHAPDSVKSTFDQVIARLHEQSINALDSVRQLAEAGNTNALAQTCHDAAPALRDLIDEASAIVNQQQGGQAEVDEIF